PKAIAELAKDFQRDALRLQTAGEARQHVDIEYRALNVSVRDREHAIFNLLRFYEARTAIVFCKTRVNVNHLLARMGNRGFQVVALSGELSQQERTHALQSLRDGRARVCIATDVAARGIDLPGLDLVIHADLPSNSETLLHRSGRTGRAGSKGVSALIVTPADFRKAQRLLQGAKVVAEWAKAPSAEEVQAKDDMRILEHPALTAPVAEDAAMVASLLERFGPEQAAAAFVRLWREGRSAPEELHDAAAAPAAPRERSEFGDSVWFALSVGRSGRAEARWLLPKICDGGGITKNEIGAIRVQEDETFVQIGKAVAGKFGQGLELESGVVMRRIEGEPSLDRPERSPRKAFDKPAGSAPRPVRGPAQGPVREKPAYVPKPARVVEDGDEAAPRPAYAKREARQDEGDRKPWAPREDGPKKPYAAREEGPRKPYAKREDGEKKPWAPRQDGPAKPYAAREDGPRKPYAKRDEGDRKPYAPRAEGAKPYAKRDDAGARPPASRKAAEGEDRKPRWKAGDKPAGGAGRSAGFKSHGGGEGDARPARAAGYKSHAAEGKAGGKPFVKSGVGKPAFAKAKPAAVKTDAKDTSKRFTPPKKPRS
ncbi:MAG TPA: helicase-related protein, partial [Paracoccaceae bacterium]